MVDAGAVLPGGNRLDGAERVAGVLSVTEAQIIDKLCAALSDESAAVMLEISEGMTAVGWDDSGGVARARRLLQARLNLEPRT